MKHSVWNVVILQILLSSKSLDVFSKFEDKIWKLKLDFMYASEISGDPSLNINLRKQIDPFKGKNSKLESKSNWKGTWKHIMLK